MLNVKFICVGKMKERFYLDAFEEYRKRLGAYCRLELAEIQEQRLPERPSQAEIDAALEREAEEILKAFPGTPMRWPCAWRGKSSPASLWRSWWREERIPASQSSVLWWEAPLDWQKL